VRLALPGCAATGGAKATAPTSAFRSLPGLSVTGATISPFRASPLLASEGRPSLAAAHPCGLRQRRSCLAHANLSAVNGGCVLERPAAKNHQGHFEILGRSKELTESFQRDRFNIWFCLSEMIPGRTGYGHDVRHNRGRAGGEALVMFTELITHLSNGCKQPPMLSCHTPLPMPPCCC